MNSVTQAVRDYPQLAKDIIDDVGGESNIIGATRCATRLLLVLAETPADAKAKVSTRPGVITVVQNSGQFQVVIGTHVGEVFQQVSQDLDLENNPRGEGQGKESILNRVIATMSAVFAPFVYILAAAGLIQGALIITSLIVPSIADTGAYAVFDLMSWAPFTFLPILIAITASRHFQCNTYVAVTACAALVSPSYTALAEQVAAGARIDFFGIALSQTTYTSTVLPPLVLVWALSYLERFVDKRLPGFLRALFTPFICLVIIVPVAALVIGPLTSGLAFAVADGYNGLYDAAPVAAGAVIGGLFQVLVIFGVHWATMPMVLANHEVYGSDSWQAFQTAAVIAQLGAVIGVVLRTRNRQMRNVAGSAALPGLFGITEPIIYGVNLRLKRPFILGCVAGAAGGVVIALFGSLYYVFAGLPSILTIVNAHNPENPSSLMGEILGCAVAFFGALILVWIFGFKDPVEDLGTEPDEEAPVSTLTPDAYKELVDPGGGHTRIMSPMDGRVLPLSAVPDPVFAEGSMGLGVAIEPTGNQVYSPVTGKVVMVFPTKHAIGLKSDDGLELLIHMGLDTVQLKGEGFAVNVAKGDRVEVGDLLAEFDPKVITEAGYSLITPIIVTNSAQYDDIPAFPQETVKHGHELAVAIQAENEGAPA